MKRALICGVSGQDGSYLAKFLLDKGYEVWGSSRDAQLANLANHEFLGIGGQVKMESMAPGDFRSVLNAISRSEPDEIYYLSGQSSVGLSFSQPAESMESIAHATLNILEAVRFLNPAIRLYNAGSSECFGEVPEGSKADENTPFRPRSPYGVAKASAHWTVANYREAYGLHCSNGILFNHESPLRPRRFVTRKIVSSACRISGGNKERLILGDISVARDWGWSPEYVDPMWRMLQMEHPDDYVIATGETHSLRDFIEKTFGYLGLDWNEHVDVDETLMRPSEIHRNAASTEKASRVLDWRAQVKFENVVEKLIAAEMALLGA
jgi:GDPmannose 4,6-dehydratase